MFFFFFPAVWIHAGRGSPHAGWVQGLLGDRDVGGASESAGELVGSKVVKRDVNPGGREQTRRGNRGPWDLRKEGRRRQGRRVGSWAQMRASHSCCFCRGRYSG